jgi:hypothetical protein
MPLTLIRLKEQLGVKSKENCRIGDGDAGRQSRAFVPLMRGMKIKERIQGTHTVLRSL